MILANKMGQCMPSASDKVIHHPSLGVLHKTTYQNKNYLTLKVNIIDEEDYI